MNCWVTLADSVDYLKCAYALALSLQQAHSKYPLCIMIPEGAINQNIVDDLEKRLLESNAYIKKIPYLFTSFDVTRWSTTINKFYIFALIDYEKICFLDADNYIISNADMIFEERLPAAALRGDEGINGNIIVIKPDLNAYALIMSLYIQQYETFKTDEDCLNFLHNNKLIYFQTFFDITYNGTILHDGGLPKYWFQYPSFDEIYTTVNYKSNIVTTINHYMKNRVSIYFNPEHQKQYINMLIPNIMNQYEENI